MYAVSKNFGYIYIFSEKFSEFFTVLVSFIVRSGPLRPCSRRFRATLTYLLFCESAEMPSRAEPCQAKSFARPSRKFYTHTHISRRWLSKSSRLYVKLPRAVCRKLYVKFSNLKRPPPPRPLRTQPRRPTPSI